ncbi:hypothetical protein [Arenimonas sp. MALMAid1274]|uniref:hypothetical protein n=1 Tax=Arenimonas sp. MALMAid1274 TaxID=3411630 RepID=UPI003B9F25E6
MNPVMSQRIRNRVIDCLEIAADESKQDAFGPDGVVNLWEDWRGAALGPPPISSLTPDELAAVYAFDAMWVALAEGTSNPMPALAELRQIPLWQSFVAAARCALAELSQVGRLPEDRPVA